MDADFISRLGYRLLQPPRQYHCMRNGESLGLTVHAFENRQLARVLYFTEAVYLPSGRPRHSTLFHFNADSAHEALHNYCLHALFFDERIGERFEEENKFHPPAHLNAEKAEILHHWIRIYWNSHYFATRYQELGGLAPGHDLIRI